MIITLNEEILRKKSEKVSVDEAKLIINKLEKELIISEKNGQPGIGLAAPQIVIHKQVAIIRFGKISLDLVNPVIVQGYDKIIFDMEGCLSFPGKIAKTLRFNEIVVKTDVKPFHFIATNILSVAIQHEIDHLNGILLMDREIGNKQIKE